VRPWLEGGQPRVVADSLDRGPWTRPTAAF
jgi:hypothetical protein